MSDVTRVLARIESGDQQASEDLLPLVYDELCKLAAARMASEPSDHTLQPTALVHEAYMRLVDVADAQQWKGRGHFFSAAAEAMRRILIERARRKGTLRAGRDIHRVDIEQVEPTSDSPNIDIFALSEALDALEKHDPRKAELVKLRYFAGMSVRAAAETLGIAPSTAIADWAYAKGWLRLRMSGDAQ